MAEAALGLGSNLGDRLAHLTDAVQALSMLDDVMITARSSVWETQPWGVEDQPSFFNACVLIETILQPFDLLDACIAIEHAQGRERGLRWGPRTLDIDVLFHGNTELMSDRLTLPHPRLTVRSFVLAPLAEIAPQKFVHGRTVEDHLNETGDDGIVRVGALQC